jgi:hypothetical protein
MGGIVILGEGFTFYLLPRTVPFAARLVRIVLIVPLTWLAVQAGPLGFDDSVLLEQAQPIPHCGECSFIVTLESPPQAVDPADEIIVLSEMGTLGLIGFAGMKWRVRGRRWG